MDDSALLAKHSQEADRWEAAFEELQGFRELADDWDGQNAKAPPVELVDSALRLARILRSQRSQSIDPPTRIIPGINGTIIFEWQDGTDYYEIEVLSPGYAEMVTMVPEKPAEMQKVTW